MSRGDFEITRTNKWKRRSNLLGHQYLQYPNQKTA